MTFKDITNKHMKEQLKKDLEKSNTPQIDTKASRNKDLKNSGSVSLISKATVEKPQLKEVSSSDGRFPSEVLKNITKECVEKFKGYVTYSSSGRVYIEEAIKQAYDIGTLKADEILCQNKVFTTSMNRKVCYEAGFKDAIEKVEEEIKKLIDIQGDKDCKLDKDESDCLPCYCSMVLEELKEKLKEF